MIANFDEREALLAQRRIDSDTAPGGDVQVTICPTLACNFECPYCFATRGKGKMSEDVQDDVVALVGRMLDDREKDGRKPTPFRVGFSERMRSLALAPRGTNERIQPISFVGSFVSR